MKCTVYFKNETTGKNDSVKYADVTGVRAGSAGQILGEKDARGNGIAANTPLIQLLLASGETATFNADNVTILC